MDDISTTRTELDMLIEDRLAVLRNLSASLEFGTAALVKNDAEAIARGAAHQAELCRQWSCLEDELRRQTAKTTRPRLNIVSSDLAQGRKSARLQADWEELSVRIRYLTRVHSSLLRHLQRSLAILHRVVDTCAFTYTPDPAMLRTVVPLQVIGE